MVRTISMLRMDDSPVFDRNDIREPGLADGGKREFSPVGDGGFVSQLPLCG